MLQAEIGSLPGVEIIATAPALLLGNEDSRQPFEAFCAISPTHNQAISQQDCAMHNLHGSHAISSLLNSELRAYVRFANKQDKKVSTGQMQ